MPGAACHLQRQRARPGARGAAALHRGAEALPAATHPLLGEVVEETWRGRRRGERHALKRRSPSFQGEVTSPSAPVAPSKKLEWVWRVQIPSEEALRALGSII